MAIDRKNTKDTAAAVPLTMLPTANTEAARSIGEKLLEAVSYDGVQGLVDSLKALACVTASLAGTAARMRPEWNEGTVEKFFITNLCTLSGAGVDFRKYVDI